MNRTSMSAAIAVVGLVALGLAGIASATEDNVNVPALGKALGEASVPLDQGLKAAAREGTPISGKFELEKGALQPSVYTMKEDKFSELVIDTQNGSIKKAEPIGDSNDFKDAKEQRDAMVKAKRSLETATKDAVAGNSGYRALSIVPALKDGRPVATVTLMKATDVKQIVEKLD